MAGIDWLSNPAPDVVYLVRGEYRSSLGVVKRVRWCGPSERMGSGLYLRDPDDTSPRSKPMRWETRLSGVSMDATLGRLNQSVQAVSDMDLTVHLGNWDPLAGAYTDLDDDDLTFDITDGSWANQSVSLWLLDRNTGDTQQFFRGRWDRNPSAVQLGSFAMRAVESIFPLDEPVLDSAFPTGNVNPPDWTDQSTIAGQAE